MHGRIQVEVDQALCVGHGKCYALSPQHFAPDDDDAWGRSRPLSKHVAEDDRKAIDAAIAACPEFAILLVQEREQTNDQ